MSGVSQQIVVTVRTLDGTVKFTVTESAALELRDALGVLS